MFSEWLEANRNLVWLIFAGSFLLSIVAIILWAVWAVRRLKKNKLVDSPPVSDSVPILEIGTKLNSITTSGYYDQAEGTDHRGGHPEGDKQVHVAIVLAPSKPMRLDRLSLGLWNQKFPPDWVAPRIEVMEQSVTTTAVFNVPREFAKNTKEARIYALANGTETFSEPFALNFTENAL